MTQQIDVYIGLGSNLSQPIEQLERALQEIAQLADVHLLTRSSLYSSVPLGPQDQPDFVNGVAHLRTCLAAEALLKQLQGIELDHGRLRKDQRWGPRTLDLDILLYGQQQINQADLVIPHYGMKQREFVVYPLFEIAPELVLPCGTRLKDILNNVSSNGLQIIKQ